ncbi:Dihydrofolate reductase [Amycolatopsis arida]|uniref:Dihydrofolate reductase n=1 Tax=Amycolatopsis arida TaxID=587909 RepID=A0A1I5WX56_9PSEU|nr:dihydrofolate reductase family protein [Amycolatopsis arida]TDX92495.1 dihydrofolate reductase [Amycolatopsis arida]SFQ24264.1 Dihydrofolate reductase [Amycolatopsis arida]
MASDDRERTMGRVCYSMIVSLDGYVEDAAGSIAFLEPDEEVHRLANEQARSAAAFLFGRRLYEVMEEPWTAAAARADLPEVEREFARIYLDTPRIMFSDTLDTVPDGVRVVRRDQAEAEVRRLKRSTEGDLSLGGPTLAAALVDLIDEFAMFVLPVVLGGGTPYLAAGTRVPLRLAEQRTFPSGTVYLRYVRA